MNEYLPYLGKYEIFFPLTAFVFLFLGITIFYCNSTGPNKFLSTAVFWLPVIYAVALAVLLFYSNKFGISFVIYSGFLFAANIMSFIAFEATLDDKTGTGAAMFFGFASMLIMGMTLGLKVAHYAYTHFMK